MQNKGGDSKNGSAKQERRSHPKWLEKYKLEYDDSLVGITIEKWLIHGKIGSGAMGSVYLAEELGTKERRALKMINQINSDSKDAEERFDREALALAKLGHPNIVDIFHLGSFGKNRYMVMELIDGMNLGDLHKSESPSLERVKKLMLQICYAVEAAHREGIMHRDLKPANIMVSKKDGKDVVKLLDFGLAKSTIDQQKTLTQLGYFVGTIAYAAPEQAMGNSDYDYRVDIYALGVILYELTTGKLPFKGKTYMETINMHKNEPPSPPRQLNPQISPDLEKIILKALSKKPRDRHQSAREMADELKDAAMSIKSDDMLIAELLDESGQPTVKGAKAPPPVAPKRITPPPDSKKEYENEEPKPSGIGKFLLISALVAGVAGAVAYYRNDISKLVQGSSPASNRPSSSARPHSSGVPSTAVGEVTINAPPRARIFVANGRYLGEVPADGRLTVSLNPDETRLYVWVGSTRYNETISPGQTSLTVAGRGTRPRAPSQTRPTTTDDVPAQDQNPDQPE